MKKLIINADDFGLTKEISDEIINIFLLGNISSTSLMVNTPGTNHAIELAKRYPKLGVGLHLNLTEGKAMSGISSITNSEGDFLGKLPLNLGLYSMAIKLSDIRLELISQYEYLINSGILISHIDSHQHMHMNPRIFKIVADFAKDQNIPVRIAFPQVIRRKKGGLNYKKRFKQFILNYAALENMKYASKISVRFNKSFNSIFDFHPFQMPKENDYIKLIESSKSNFHELMVHTYKKSKELVDFYSTEYNKKLDFFNKAQAEMNILSKKNIFKSYELITFRDL